ncbi:inositol 2-dehydrogenase [Aquiflexum sp. LQ15W]|uniref:inositol 2-dehydrogenase n=1 Tax=Cognataquiflexum nitidum TaxID=2922272 RepID=UPI001F142B82|nr:inositol 2-dehydrogenase [Cognataquiflexum nitidum]MCH6198917.1 inositol 2-dehydrogenase [Cognataquiflexum nitidum]
MKKVRIGIIGMGRIGKIHYDNLKNKVENTEVVSFSDPFFKESLEIPNLEVEALVSCKEVDAVIICSPTNTHADYISLCAKHKKDVFCEKPHDLSLPRVIESLQEVKAAGIKLMLGFNRRFDPNFLKIKKLVMDGKIGEPFLIKITSRDPAPPSLSYLKSSGGMFLDMTIHDFDMARYIMGKEVTEVYAVGGAFVSEDVISANDIDIATVTLKFEDNTMALIDNSRKAVYGYDQRLEVFGSGGMAKAENNNHDTHTLYNEIGAHSSLPLDFFMDRYTSSYLNEIKSFINSIVLGTNVSVTGEDGFQALKIGIAAGISIRENRPVKINEINQLQSIL